MAKNTKQTPNKGYVLTDAEKYIIAENAKRLEDQKEKSYQDFLNYAEKNKDNLNFRQNGIVSAYESASPYYGDEMQNQYEAAIQYAAKLRELNDAKVTIPNTYYEKFTKQVPISIDSSHGAHFDVTNQKISVPSPKMYALSKISLGENPDLVSKNNYGPNALSSDEVSKNLMSYWLGSIEHEAGHIPDSEVKFAKKPPVTLSTHNVSSALADLGYMGKEDHLVTGLSKVQREQYAMTGKRFESPQEFKDFIFNLASSKNPEEQISGFSEEAKRALRPQIENAVKVKEFEDLFNAWKNNKSFFRGSEPKIMGDPDFLEKSMQLIPALVSNRDYTNYTS